MRKTFLVLGLVGAVGFGAWRFVAPAPVAKSPLERLKAASPLETVRTPRPAANVAREVVAPAPSQVSAQRAQMDERFNELKDEGRRVRQALTDSDPKAAQAYDTINRRPEYRALLDQRHQIEAAWANAPEGERDGMLAQMNSLRQQGFTLILNEMQRLKTEPTAASPASDNTVRVQSAPVVAPTPPVVFQ